MIHVIYNRNQSEGQEPLGLKNNQNTYFYNFRDDDSKTAKSLQNVLSWAQVSSIAALVLTNSGFCLANHLHDKVMFTALYLNSICSKLSFPIDKLGSFPIEMLAQNLPKKLKYISKELQFLFSLTITAPLAEEVFFRGLIQELLLKRWPAALLYKIDPKAAKWVESNPNARVGRVAISTLLFALAHIHPNCAMSNRVIGVLGGGIALGSFVEVWGHKIGLKKALIGSIILHSKNNLFAYVLNKGLGISIDPIFDR